MTCCISSTVCKAKDGVYKSGKPEKDRQNISRIKAIFTSAFKNDIDSFTAAGACRWQSYN
ncbi:hypothetical protein CDQ84_12695 [Clostridium thermosuccinogenes]|uniref:Uncharacterized protein n=2 Tax=Clostridium thermosuccinogenes TaxID=84032 RepID=A0A2K2FBE1_9CLOT|nr:hypothetical protein CDO33_11645 [Pseudoclostridium thermosuccinogenes]PNT96095.1 hypothetical protein CDQ85_12735 [Pseudoclostridium thermosuccinogenes]PNT97706.1 hypothetical protein CDQ84_12695 [Pseudoclostridium thermosuccinogenes]